MHAPRSTLAVALFGVSLMAAALVGACSGGEFSEAPAGGAGSAGSGSGGGGGPPGGTVRCTGPAECDDGDPCTVDACGAEGSCVYTPKCAPGERCCDGACGECCVQEDCMDAVSCTADQCFNLFCAFVPDDDACDIDQYCHASEDCKDKEPCPGGTDAECDDGDPCTTDSCSDGYCEHEYCRAGQQCCPGVGCASCCGDAQCPGADDNLCTKGVCVEGRCEVGPLCTGANERCCEGGDHASCGACCDALDCIDEFDCTTDQCLGGECSHIANDAACKAGEVCDPQRGCVPVATCDGDGDCVSADPCQTGVCKDGVCSFAGCSDGLTCCPGVGCRQCCDNTQCGGQLCCNGVCQQCCTRYDCGYIQAAPIPPLGCENTQCVSGVCMTTYEVCDFSYCCAPYGCSINLCEI